VRAPSARSPTPGPLRVQAGPSDGKLYIYAVGPSDSLGTSSQRHISLPSSHPLLTTPRSQHNTSGVAGVQLGPRALSHIRHPVLSIHLQTLVEHGFPIRIRSRSLFHRRTREHLCARPGRAAVSREEERSQDGRSCTTFEYILHAPLIPRQVLSYPSER
jgi:hypothetical protein